MNWTLVLSDARSPPEHSLLGLSYLSLSPFQLNMLDEQGDSSTGLVNFTIEASTFHEPQRLTLMEIPGQTVCAHQVLTAWRCLIGI